MTKKILVWDVDGTIANIEHRREHVRNGRRNWKKFNELMVNDTPYEDMHWLFQMLWSVPDVVMLIASGRGEEDRRKTENWLNAHGFSYEKLYMRPAKDSRKDSIIKKEILEQIITEWGQKPFMVFDDRPQVVRTWRENGIRVLDCRTGDPLEDF